MRECRAYDPSISEFPDIIIRYSLREGNIYIYIYIYVSKYKQSIRFLNTGSTTDK